MNGEALCTLMNSIGMMPSYGDTCTFTCDTGYELTGSDTRTCQSNGSWSGSDVMCTRDNKLCDQCYVTRLLIMFNIILQFHVHH